MMSGAKVEPAECQLDVNNFVDTIFDQKVHFQVLKMKDSFFVWIGWEAAKLGELAVAMKTCVDKDPSTTALFGENVDLLSGTLAKKLAKATNKQVFASYNLPSDQQMFSLVEKRLHGEMKTHPDWF